MEFSFLDVFQSVSSNVACFERLRGMLRVITLHDMKEEKKRACRGRKNQVCWGRKNRDCWGKKVSVLSRK